MPPPMTATSAIVIGPLPRPASAGGDRRSGLRSNSDPPEGIDQAVDLGLGVVVGQPDPDDATVVGETEPLDQARRIEVAVPDGDALIPQGRGDVSGSDPGQADCCRRCSLVESGSIRDAVEGEARDGLQAVGQMTIEAKLVVADRAHAADDP